MKASRCNDDRASRFLLTEEDITSGKVVISGRSEIEKASDYWSRDIQERAKIITAPEALKNTFIEILVRSSPYRNKWPYGMPTSVNPYLLFIGINPGGRRDRKPSRDELISYIPTVGIPHPNFDLDDQWKSPYWRKIRAFARGYFKRLGGLDEATALAFSGHLNLAVRPTPNASDSVVDKRLLRWLPSVIGSSLRPEIVVLFGLSKRIGSIGRTWKESPMGFINSEPTEIPLNYNGKRKYFFRMWTNPDPLGKPRLVVLFPNHPSRHPFSDSTIWRKAIDQFSTITREALQPGRVGI